MEYVIRSATASDINTIITFTVREAQESQGSEVDLIAVERGVSSAFTRHPRSQYWIMENADGSAVAHTSIIKEWSDFCGKDYWWIQSFYIAPEHRGRGLADQLINHLSAAAISADALELRLYVHGDNQRAIRAYQRCGFSASPYLMMKTSL